MCVRSYFAIMQTELSPKQTYYGIYKQRHDTQAVPLNCSSAVALRLLWRPFLCLHSLTVLTQGVTVICLWSGTRVKDMRVTSRVSRDGEHTWRCCATWPLMFTFSVSSREWWGPWQSRKQRPFLRDSHQVPPGGFCLIFIFKIFLFFKRFCLVLYFRERACMQVLGEGQKVRERLSQHRVADSMLNLEPNRGFDPMIITRPRPKPRVRCSTSWATQMSPTPPFVFVFCCCF